MVEIYFPLPKQERCIAITVLIYQNASWLGRQSVATIQRESFSFPFWIFRHTRIFCGCMQLTITGSCFGCQLKQHIWGKKSYNNSKQVPRYQQVLWLWAMKMVAIPALLSDPWTCIFFLQRFMVEDLSE